MVNSDNLKERLSLDSKQNELKKELDDIRNEINDLQEIRNNIYETLCRLDKKIASKEGESNNIMQELQEVALVKELLYGRLNQLGNVYESNINLSDEYKKLLEKNGCKITMGEDNRCKIKRIILHDTSK